MNNKKYDLVVYGATGFTGQLICEYLSTHKDAADLNWAISGRNTSKLEAISNQFSTENKKIDVLYADSFDKASLDNITSKNDQKTLNLLSKNKTCLFVTHNTDDILDAQKIVSLENGEIIDITNKNKLLNK